ncbi:Trp biosynthesis-associated membrane protein [Nocardioides sp. zg-1308]|uniref:Trp biosynthesis-associated membrane protein n=1 Tax=Nocardioides sp. zg-1308 TaxID=2736253 RepID=UPI001552AD89|nr:Trp biosynthesis-associated membrane protein [Nocardioides sp. zg-1308]NPD06413.1 Trp biosynthesis-associated membrane protein [Nocardioides sp. zg-1308]
MADEAGGAARSRRTFGPVVLLGLAGAALAAVAGSKPWVEGTSGSVSSDTDDAMASVLALNSAAESPLAAALALALLACWGVLLVTRGRVRRAVAVLALVAAVGLVITTVEAFWSLPDTLADALLEVSGTDTVSTGITAWYVAGLVAAALSVAAAAAALRFVGSWPEMGTRYDAPTGTRGEPDGDRSAVPTDNIDIWKALDEGRDPTA